MAKSDHSNGGGAFGWQLFWGIIALLMVGTVGVISLPAFYEVYGWITSGNASFETIPSYTSYGISLLAIIAVVWVLSRSGSQNALLSLVAVIGLTALGSAPYLSGVTTTQLIEDDPTPRAPVTPANLQNIDQLEGATIVDLTLGAPDNDLVVARGESVSQGEQYGNMLFFTFDVTEEGTYWIDSYDHDAANNDDYFEKAEVDTALILFDVSDDGSLVFTELFDDDGGFLEYGARLRGYLDRRQYLAVITNARSDLGAENGAANVGLEVRSLSPIALQNASDIRTLDAFENNPITLSRQYDEDSALRITPDIYKISTHMPSTQSGENPYCAVIDVTSVTEADSLDGLDPAATLYMNDDLRNPILENDDHSIPEASGVLDGLASLIAFDPFSMDRESISADFELDERSFYVVVTPVYGDLPGAEYAIRSQLLPIKSEDACSRDMIDWASFAGGNAGAPPADN